MEDQNNEKQGMVSESNEGIADMSQTLQSMAKNCQLKDEARHFESESSSDESDLDLDLELRCETCNKTFSGVKPLLQHEKSSKHHKALQQIKIGKKVNTKLENEDSGEIQDLLPEFYAECNNCRKQFSGPESFHQHLKSKAHQKKMVEAKLLEQVTDNGKIDVKKLKDICKQKKMFHSEAAKAGSSPTFEETEDYEQNIADTHQFECKECDKKFTGINNWYQHLVSKVHEKAMKQKGLLEKLNLGGPSRSTTQTESAGASSIDADVIDMDDDVLSCRLCHKSFSGPESAEDHLKSRGHAKKKELKEWKLKHPVKKALRSAAETKKTTAPDERNESEISNPTPGLETIHSSSSNVEGEGAVEISERRTGTEEVTQCTEDATSDAKVENKSADLESKNQNTLLCYESYKRYKKIMNEIEAKQQMM